jgi:quercetin dioxygenase-like cupin family protein
MSRMITILAIAALAPLFLVNAVTEAHSAEGHVHVSGDKLVWNDFHPPGFPQGAMIAVVHGNPKQKAPYTVRINLPDGYVIPVHLHSGDESLTVLSGTFRLAMGKTWDESKLPRYRAGDFLFIPANMPHFGGAIGPTMVQIHGIGPFTTTVLEPVAEQ